MGIHIASKSKAQRIPSKGSESTNGSFPLRDIIVEAEAQAACTLWTVISGEQILTA